MSLRRAISFGAFLDISDSELCLFRTPNASLRSLSVQTDMVEQSDAEKHAEQVKRHNANVRIGSLSYNKAIALVRRLFNKASLEKSF
ncbi:hypothetical protein N7540_003249 [Penicillium herquei]|nr:hypothetical protein N7540_003249 [Penicillium herquei]